MKNNPLLRVLLVFCATVIPRVTFSQIPTRIIVNSGFESPVIGCSPASYSFIPHGNISGWRTLDSLSAARVNCGVTSTNAPYLIEFWSNGFNSRSSHAGSQMAEINASRATFLYQEICVLANEVVPFSVWHLRRASSGTGEQMVAELKTTNNVNIATASTHIATGSWTNYTGNLTNNGSNGIRRYGFRAISGGSLGNLVDDVTISLKPLVDTKDFTFTTVYETDTNYLRLYVNGTLRGAATVNITKGGTATYLSDYLVGTPNRGSVSVAMNGDLVLTLPAGDYNPNIASGSNIGFISIPCYTVNDGLMESNEDVQYTITGSANGGNGNAALDLVTNINGQSAACAPTVATAQFTVRDAVALPVRLISFTAESEVGFNKIAWQVAEEININKYLLEYSLNGTDFILAEEIFSNPSKFNEYSTVHVSKETRVVYYRLSVIDKDGYLSVLSDVIEVSKNINSTFSIFPNPNTGSFTLNFYSVKEMQTEFRINDQYGKQISQMVFNSVKGDNAIPVHLDQELSTGIYFISYTYGNSTKTIRVNILR